MLAAMRAFRIQEGDNVAVALSDLAAGEEIPLSGEAGGRVRALEQIPFAHKLALENIEQGRPILKYGVPVGFARRPIQRGEWVHTHNVESYFVARKRGELS